MVLAYFGTYASVYADNNNVVVTCHDEIACNWECDVDHGHGAFKWVVSEGPGEIEGPDNRIDVFMVSAEESPTTLIVYTDSNGPPAPNAPGTIGSKYLPCNFGAGGPPCVMHHDETDPIKEALEIEDDEEAKELQAELKKHYEEFSHPVEAASAP